MTFITVVRNNTFPAGSVEVELTGQFTGNLTGNVLNATVIQSLEGQFDTISASTTNGAITFSDDLCIAAANVLQVDTVTDKSGSGISIEDVTILNGEFTSNVCIDAAQYLQTDNIEAKGTLITIHDPILMNAAGDQIRFTNGIEIGSSTTSTTGTGSIAIGKGALTLAVDSVAIGFNANVIAQNGVAIGTNTVASGAYYSIAIGGGTPGLAAMAQAYGAIAIGYRAYTSTNSSDSICIGRRSYTNSYDCIAIGRQTQAYGGYYGVAIGRRAYAGENGSVSLGAFAGSYGNKCITIGYSAGTGSEPYGIAIGYGANNGGNKSIAIGYNTSINATAPDSIAFGTTAEALAPQSIAIGKDADCAINAFNAVVLGVDAFANAGNAIAIGTQASCSGSNSVVIGRSGVTSGPSVVAIGYFSSIAGTRSVGIGAGSESNSDYNTVIGAYAYASGGMFPTNAVAIGHQANVYVTDDVQLGRNVGTTGSGILHFHAQTVSDEAWADSLIGFAKIDGAGNIFKDTGALTINGNLDMFCYNISNVDVLELNTMTAKTAGTINVGANLTIDATYTLSADTISETTAAAGVTVDGVLLKDNDVEADEVRTDTLSVKAGTQITVTEDLVPSVNATYDLGKTSFRWNNVYGTTLNVSGNATILGNLTVSGNLTTIDTENILIADNKILLNNGEMGAGVTLGAAGWEVDRGSLTNFNVCFDELRDCLVTGIDTVVANLVCVAGRVDSLDNNGIAYFNSDGVLDTDSGFVRDTANNQIIVDTVCATVEVDTDTLDDKAAGFITVNAPFVMSATGEQIRFTNGIEIGDSSVVATNGTDVAVGKATDATGGNSVALGQGAQATAASAVAVGLTATSAFASAVAIGSSATAGAANCVQLGQATDSGTNATLKFRSQIIGNEAWIAGGLTPASIDNNGNIIRGNAEATVSNLICATIAVQTPLLEGKDNMQINVGDDLVMDAANVFKSDTIESTSGGDILFNDSICVAAGNDVQTDTINEKTAAAGVTIDGVLLKDNNVTATTVNATTVEADDVNTANLTVDVVSPNNGTDITFNGTTNTFAATTNNITGTSSTFNGNVTVSGFLNACNIKYCYEEISSNVHAIIEADDILGGNTLANAIVFTLPQISSITGGGYKRFTIVDIGGNASGNNITVVTSGSDTLFGGNTMVLSGDYNAFNLYNDGVSKWFFA